MASAPMTRSRSRTNTSNGITKGSALKSFASVTLDEHTPRCSLTRTRQLLPSTRARTLMTRRSAADAVVTGTGTATETTETEIPSPLPSTPESEFRVEFQAYPYPPSRHPLCRPLLSSAVRDPCLRRRLVKRWKRDMSPSCHGLGTDLPISCTLQADSMGRQPPRKRLRSPLFDYNFPSTLNLQRDAATVDRHEGYGFDECSSTGPRSRKQVRKQARKPSTCAVVEDSNYSVIEYTQDRLPPMHPQCDTQALTVDSKLDVDNPREALQEYIDELQRRKAWMEVEEIDEIVRLSKGKVPPTTLVLLEDRSQLKADLETLNPRAVRDVVRLLLGNMELMHRNEPFEVKLHLDLLPFQTVRELQTVVKREKGLIVVPSSQQLEHVRKQLKEARRRQRMAGTEATTS